MFYIQSGHLIFIFKNAFFCFILLILNLIKSFKIFRVNLVFNLLKMIGTIKDPTLFLLLSSVGILLFGSIGYGIYTTLGPSSYKLRDTIKEHARMHELGIAHGHNHHNHNKSEHIH